MKAKKSFASMLTGFTGLALTLVFSFALVIALILLLS